MPTTKVHRIQDPALRKSLAQAHASLRSGDYLDVVRRCADAALVILSEAKNLSSPLPGLDPS